MRPFLHLLNFAVAIVFITNAARLSSAVALLTWLRVQNVEAKLRAELQCRLNDKLKPGLKEEDEEKWNDFVNYAKRSLGIKRVVFLHPNGGHREHIFRIVDLHGEKNWKIWEGLERKQSRDVEEVISKFCGSQRKRTLVIGTAVKELRKIYQGRMVNNFCVVALADENFKSFQPG